MQTSDNQNYIDKLVNHYQQYFGIAGKRLTLQRGPTEKLPRGFIVLELPPNDKHQMYCYCTVGMSVDRVDDNLIELVLYSPKAAEDLVELLTVCASYHSNGKPLNIHHTVNIGQPWLDHSVCDHGFISLPYLDGEGLELFHLNGRVIHCYWFIPITQAERDYKIEQGCEALEQLFEDNQLDYLNPHRASLIR